MYKTVRYGDIDVYYEESLHGGGMTFGQEFISAVKKKVGPIEHLFEFCAGPGFIGFSLLAEGLCKKLTLADINPAAVESCRETIRANSLSEKVSVYLSDCLDDIPETEKWDLVVSNPPHFESSQAEYESDIRRFDPGWTIHRRFYRDISKYLKPNGTILFQENMKASSTEDFLEMIRQNGLAVTDEYYVTSTSAFYFVTSKPASKDIIEIVNTPGRKMKPVWEQ